MYAFCCCCFRTQSLINGSGGNPTRGSENSLLNLTDEDLWLRKGMDEDGSFREGRYSELE